MKRVFNQNIYKSIEDFSDILLLEVIGIMEEDIKINKQIGTFGAGLLKNFDTVLTHCNAGALATAGYGHCIRYH